MNAMTKNNRYTKYNSKEYSRLNSKDLLSGYSKGPAYRAGVESFLGRLKIGMGPLKAVSSPSHICR